MAKNKNKPEVDVDDFGPAPEPPVEPEPVFEVGPERVVFQSVGGIGGVFIHEGLGYPGSKTIPFIGGIYATENADEIAALRQCVALGSVIEVQ